MAQHGFFNYVLIRIAKGGHAAPCLAVSCITTGCRCFEVRRLPKEKVMAVRIFALLIPLAITLPQLQTSRPSAAAPAAQATQAQPASAPEKPDGEAAAFVGRH